MSTRLATSTSWVTAPIFWGKNIILFFKRREILSHKGLKYKKYPPGCIPWGSCSRLRDDVLLSCPPAVSLAHVPRASLAAPRRSPRLLADPALLIDTLPLAHGISRLLGPRRRGRCRLRPSRRATIHPRPGRYYCSAARLTVARKGRPGMPMLSGTTSAKLERGMARGIPMGGDS